MNLEPYYTYTVHYKSQVLILLNIHFVVCPFSSKWTIILLLSNTTLFLSIGVHYGENHSQC